MRRKKHPEHANHERWLISYADFITLLFAFFVVMFATSQTDKSKAQQVSDSVKRAIEEGAHASSVMAAILGGAADDKGKGNAAQRGPGGVVKPAETKAQGAIVEGGGGRLGLSRQPRAKIRRVEFALHGAPAARPGISELPLDTMISTRRLSCRLPALALLATGKPSP